MKEGEGVVPPVHTRGNETATRPLTKLMIINQEQPSINNLPLIRFVPRCCSLSPL